MEPSEDHLSTCGHLTSLRNKPQQTQPGQISVQYLPELLVNVCSYHLMVKSVSRSCVNGRWIFSNPVTVYPSIGIYKHGKLNQIANGFQFAKVFSARLPTVLICQIFLLPKFFYYMAVTVA